MKFYSYLKKNKVLVVAGTQKGGVPVYQGSPKPITNNTPCDETNGYTRRFETPFLLTLTWDEMANNGLLNVQFDEFYGNQWNRSLGVGSATPSSVDINEVDGVETSLTFECNRYFLTRDRDYKDPTPSTSPLQMFASDGRSISVLERNEILGCKTPLS